MESVGAKLVCQPLNSRAMRDIKIALADKRSCEEIGLGNIEKVVPSVPGLVDVGINR